MACAIAPMPWPRPCGRTSSPDVLTATRVPRHRSAIGRLAEDRCTCHFGHASLPSRYFPILTGMPPRTYGWLGIAATAVPALNCRLYPFDAIGLVVIVTAAASVSFFRPEFDDFLYAPIGADRNEMPLSVLSALSRLNLDPWQEAAELSELPKDTATQRLATLIARQPGGRWAQADSKAIADRLIDLLPCRSRSRAQAGEKTERRQQVAGSPVVLICVALALVALIIAASFERSAPTDDAEAPAYSTASPPPQTSVPSSR